MTNEDFFKLFKIPENYYLERVLFIDQADDVGFSILKEYPLNSLFKPVKNRNGQDDDVVMIRIAFNKKEIDKPVKRLFIDVVKVSRYKLKHELIHSNTFEMYDTDNPEYPTEESIKESLESTQPENLSFRNVILKEDGTFFDNDESKPYYGFGLIEHVYSKHKSTYSISAAMIKIGIHKFLLRSLEYIGNLFLRFYNFSNINNKLAQSSSKDFFDFYWRSKKYKSDPTISNIDLKMNIGKPEYELISYDKFIIYPFWTITFSSIILFLFYLKDSNPSCFIFYILKKFATYIVSNSSNNLFFTSLVVLFLVISNYHKYLKARVCYTFLTLIVYLYDFLLWIKIKV